MIKVSLYNDVINNGSLEEIERLHKDVLLLIDSLEWIVSRRNREASRTPKGKKDKKDLEDLHAMAVLMQARINEIYEKETKPIEN